MQKTEAPRAFAVRTVSGFVGGKDGAAEATFVVSGPGQSVEGLRLRVELLLNAKPVPRLYAPAPRMLGPCANCGAAEVTCAPQHPMLAVCTACDTDAETRARRANLFPEGTVPAFMVTGEAADETAIREAFATRETADAAAARHRELGAVVRAAPRCTLFDQENDDDARPRCMLVASWSFRDGETDVLACEICHAEARKREDDGRNSLERGKWVRLDDARDDEIVCRFCGARDPQVTSWVDANTFEATGDESPSDDTWCTACEVNDAGVCRADEYQAESAEVRS